MIYLIGGLVLAGLLGSVSSFFVGQSTQKEKDRISYEAQLGRQIVKSAQSQFAAEERLAKSEAAYREWQNKYDDVVEHGQEVLVKYVQSPAKKCVVSDELQHAYAELVVMHSQQVSSPNRVSSAGQAAGGTDVPSGGSGGADADVGGIAAAPLDDSITFEAYKLCMEDRSNVRERLKRLSVKLRDDYQLQLHATGYTE